jgi:hypothetical protein
MSSTSKPAPPPTPQEVRKAGLVVLVGFALLAVLSRWRGHPTASLVFAAAGAGLGVPMLAGVVPVYKAWMGVAHVLGKINTTIILSVLFFLIITPLGLVFRLLGRDPLALKLDRAAATYWTPKARPAGSSSYFNQF